MKCLYWFLVIFSLSIYCHAENNSYKNRFEGIWANYPGYGQIDDFLIIKKIDNCYLVIVADVDNKAVNKGIGKIIDNDTLEYEMWNNKYTLDWFKDEEGEWLEKYIGYRKEEYPVYERIEKFSIDKF